MGGGLLLPATGDGKEKGPVFAGPLLKSLRVC